MTTTTTTIPEGRIGELVRYFLRLGCLGFGGPVALVGQMERELVIGPFVHPNPIRSGP